MIAPEAILAEFDAPPVIETVLSVQFTRLPAIKSVQMGLFWQRVRSRFPEVEEKLPLDPVTESFLDPSLPSGRVRFEAFEPSAASRLWLLNEQGTEMIQVQNDRFIKNWRKQGDADIYPRYEKTIRPAFERDFKDFQAFLAEESLGIPEINQCEITYVNHIVSGNGWDHFGEIDKVFSFWKPDNSAIPGMPEDMNMHLRFPMHNPNGQMIGRLHVNIQPALRASDGKPMYVMNLTARGLFSDPLSFFDLGRKWIVRSFENLTTEGMHRIWGKK